MERIRSRVAVAAIVAGCLAGGLVASGTAQADQTDEGTVTPCYFAHGELLPPVAASDVVAPGTVLVGVGFGNTVVSMGVETTLWVRDSEGIAGQGQTATYRVTEEDLGTHISQVASLKTGCAGGVAWARPVLVQAVGKIKVSARDKTIRAADKPVLKVAVSAKGVPEPEGKVVARWDGRKKKVVLAAGSAGKATVTLPPLSKGVHEVTVEYHDTSGNIQGVSTTKPVRLSVR